MAGTARYASPKEHRKHLCKVSGESILWTTNIDEALEFVLKARSFLCTIIIGDGMYDEVIRGRNMVEHFRSACPHVRSLIVVEKFGVWASAFAAQLEA